MTLDENSMEKETTDQKIRILIAEDERSIGELLVEVLEEEDREIDLVTDGDQAIETLRQRPYDILITDLKMPGADGVTVMKEGRKLYPDLVVIVVTGFASLETAIEALKQGAYDYIKKPFRLDEIKISVKNACEKVTLERENRLLLQKLKECLQEPSKEELSPAESYPMVYGSPPLEVFEAKRSKFLEELERLIRLKQEGFLDEIEFQTLKKHLLEQLS
ncbi:response regulator [Thermosulfuriphilus ammonigenes]|nr:response regulator [Thermosulfuriphilus ammonigenes]